MSNISTEKDQKYMSLALNLAARATGRTSPNPLVGALVVKNEIIFGEGYHHQAGTPHAEVHALAEAGENSCGADLYVSLEPCSHYGRTPPCADAIIKAGIKRVVIANIDPNPVVSGQGIERLKAAGIEVVVGVLGKEASRLNQPFFKHIQTGRPLVALKTAMTMDGKIAAASGDSKWITGESARQYVHELRNIYDAIMVGIGTVIQDDPLLNTRLLLEDKRDPTRVIIDTNLDLPLNSNIVKTANQQRTLVFCGEQGNIYNKQVLQKHGIEVIEIPANNGLISLEAVLAQLGKMDICSLLVEGGGEINAYLIEHNLVDKVYWFIAPKIIGGREAKSPVGGHGLQAISEAIEVKSLEISRFNNDILLTGFIKEW